MTDLDDLDTAMRTISQALIGFPARTRGDILATLLAREDRDIKRQDAHALARRARLVGVKMAAADLGISSGTLYRRFSRAGISVRKQSTRRAI